MPIPVRTINLLDGSISAEGNTLMFARKKYTYAAGGGAGLARTIAVTDIKGLPADYSVRVELPEDATYYITAKTQAGFTINILPRLAANTLAGGSADVLIMA